MKKLRSISWYHLVGTLPFVAAITYMTVVLVNRRWLKITAGAADAEFLLWIIQEFQYLPRREADYGDIKVCSLALPAGISADIYLCLIMDRYKFLKRNAKILSPLLKWPQENFKIAISPRFCEQGGERFTQIAIMREIIRCRQASQVKASLGLVAPALLLVSLIKGYYALEWSQIYPITPGLLSFFGPLAAALIGIAFLLAQSKSMSHIDYQADDKLKHHYSKTDTVAYTRRWDELLLPKELELANEKSRQLELYYRDQGTKRL